MLVAHLNQEPRAPHSLNPAIDAGISAAIMKALAKRPEARFGSCGDFGRAMEAALKAAGSNSSGVLVQPAMDTSAIRATPTPPDASINKLTPAASGVRLSSPSSPGAQAPPRHIASFEIKVKPDTGPTQKLQVQDVSTVRSKGREISRQLAELRKRPVSPSQARQIDAAAERVQQAVDVLGSTSKRVEFDGMRANWKGVAMCLSAGLRVPELEAVRARFLASSPAAAARGRMLLITANGFEADGKIPDALRNCELALGVDPLNLELHHKRHALLKRTPVAR